MKKELPKSWIKLAFTDILDIRGGTQPPKSNFIYESQKGYIRLLQIRDFGERPVPTYIPDDLVQYTCNENDILIARYGASIGRIVTGMAGAYNVALAKVCIPQPMNYSFVRWLLNSDCFQRPILSIQRTAQNGFNKNDLANITIPLPPLPEQERIAHKLDSLFAQLDAINEAMERIPQLLKDFRQQVLTQAVTGKLTNTNVEKRILDEFLVDVRYGTSKKSDYDIDGVPVLRIPNIIGGSIDSTDLKYTIFNEKELQQLSLEIGDVLIIRSNGSINLVGQSAVVCEKHKGYSYAGYLIRLRCTPNLNSKYLNYILNSHYLRAQIVELAHSTSGVNNINAQQIRNLKINWLPVQEQEEIVHQIESVFAKVDAIEEQYITLKEKIDTLPQAILHKAFKGELVNQLPTDGDARDLLRQIEELKKVGKKR